ncbi:hypothetical protein E2562_028661 [Oryza meyeriana var. granulata]|uniref:Protein kinase domain-containing protein n=1 Tax=Oryza meyeriana var. granulata TaxID=110450 RepID=A0A6G1BP69_9ORYZ|nr:hypothetical protein E2562_028661 [Oryza meyeriana var. granulata]
MASLLRKLFSCSCRDDDLPFQIAGGAQCTDHGLYHVQVQHSKYPLGCGTPSAPTGTLHLPINRSAPPATSGRLAALREFEHGVLSKATSRFHRRALLGEGTAGAAFRGTVLGNDGLQIPVAIKRFYATIRKEDVESVRSDLTLAGDPLRHRNLVYLIGYCLTNQTLYLVYDLMDNGNLEKHLFSSDGHHLSWSRRFSIIRGVALGLQHLHSNGSVHGSVKASKIFLEEGDLTPRLGNFGYSRLEPHMATLRDDIRVVHRLPEAAECLAPVCSAKATREADVFYFGAMVVEVVCGRRFFGGGVPDSFRLLVDWVWSLHGAGRILDAVDAALLAAADGDLNRAQAERLLLVGLACSYRDPKQRLDMDTVVKILQSDSVPPPDVPPMKPEYEPPDHHHAKTSVPQS